MMVVERNSKREWTLGEVVSLGLNYNKIRNDLFLHLFIKTLWEIGLSVIYTECFG
ncbi:Uncharacterised protein [Serratia fonticola]|uniref:Uncharacterized protein n=1 Tax=Serratia fonticola TaxID=47917 RepID=A0A4U9W1J9_SERFO|nr:Uncharacterised protein [Serratia fonticola]